MLRGVHRQVLFGGPATVDGRPVDLRSAGDLAHAEFGVADFVEQLQRCSDHRGVDLRVALPAGYPVSNGGTTVDSHGDWLEDRGGHQHDPPPVGVFERHTAVLRPERVLRLHRVSPDPGEAYRDLIDVVLGVEVEDQ